VQQKLTNPDGSLASTPVPANQIDTSTTGGVLAAQDATLGTKTALTAFKITFNSLAGTPIISRPVTIPTPPYDVPPPAPQFGTSSTLDTLDGRLTNAVLALDPLRGQAIWTQQTIAGGAGAEVRWYEVNPAKHLVTQTGDITDPNLYVFNGAISPDRRVSGGKGAYGANMVLGFDTSSASASPAVQMVSKIGNGPVSAFTPVVQSSGFEDDFTCYPSGTSCRWGDYAGASPDPSAPLGLGGGQVWFSNMFPLVASPDPNGVDWTTQNWVARP
jgi:hypothetical protein